MGTIHLHGNNLNEARIYKSHYIEQGLIIEEGMQLANVKMRSSATYFVNPACASVYVSNKQLRCCILIVSFAV